MKYYVHDNFFDEFLKEYNTLQQMADHLCDKMEDAGPKDQSRLDHKIDKIYSKMNGMRTTLYMIGLDVTYQYGKYVIVPAAK